jgi:hypothetical protein
VNPERQHRSPRRRPAPEQRDETAADDESHPAERHGVRPMRDRDDRRPRSSDPAILQIAVPAPSALRQTLLPRAAPM